MRLAQTSIDIDAPAALVWEAMLDLDRYPSWNPFILRVDRSGGGPPGVGDPLVLHVRFGGGRSYASPERVTRVEPPSTDGSVTRALLEYEYLGLPHRVGLLRGRRVQALDQQDGGPTVYTTREVFHGPLGFAVPLRAVQDGFERHADALRQHVEAG